jgi:hypothetical protein
LSLIAYNPLVLEMSLIAYNPIVLEMTHAPITPFCHLKGEARAKVVRREAEIEEKAKEDLEKARRAWQVGKIN